MYPQNSGGWSKFPGRLKLRPSIAQTAFVRVVTPRQLKQLYITNSQYDQLPVGLIAQLVEHCTGIAEVMGSNPVQAWIFFRLSFRNCLSCVVTARIFLLFDLSSAVQIYVSYIYIHLFILHGYITNSQYDQLPVGLIAQLVEHCTGIAEVMGSNPVQAWIFFFFFMLSFRNCLSCVVTARIFLLFDLSSAVQIYVSYIYIHNKIRRFLFKFLHKIITKKRELMKFNITGDQTPAPYIPILIQHFTLSFSVM